MSFMHVKTSAHALGSVAQEGKTQGSGQEGARGWAESRLTPPTPPPTVVDTEEGAGADISPREGRATEPLTRQCW